MVGPGRNKTSGARLLQRWSHIPLRQALQASRSFVQHSVWPGRQLKKNRAGLPSLGQALKLPTVFHFHWIFVFYFTSRIQNIEQTVLMWHLFPEMWCAPKKNPFHLKFPPGQTSPRGCSWLGVNGWRFPTSRNREAMGKGWSRKPEFSLQFVEIVMGLYFQKSHSSCWLL